MTAAKRKTKKPSTKLFVELSIALVTLATAYLRYLAKDVPSEHALPAAHVTVELRITSTVCAEPLERPVCLVISEKTVSVGDARPTMLCELPMVTKATPAELHHGADWNIETDHEQLCQVPPD